MARNGSGTYTTVNTFVAGDTITALSHNQNMSDIAAELTNSVAADGQTTMTGPLKAASGTASAPGITFGSDPDTGAYRIGSNNYGVAVAGAKVLDVSATGLAVTGAIDVSGAVKRAGVPLIPVGLGPLPWCGLSAPSGWVLCYGQSLSRATYADLWTFAAAEIALGNPLFTNGDGSTTFTILDMRGYVAAGQDDMGGSSANRLTGVTGSVNGDTFGATGGAETHTLTTAELASHGHGVTDAGHTHTTDMLGNTGIAGYPAAGNSGDAGEAPSSLATTGITIQNTGGGGAHNNVQPTRVLNQIIYAGV